MTTKKLKRGKNLNYSRSLFLKSLFNIFTWTVFGVTFIILGKRCVEIDILEEIAWIFNKDWKFKQYFVGNGLEEKIRLLNFSLYFIIAIISLNLISLLINNYLWKKDRYIENNNFYLHNKSVFVVNSLIHIACACLLTISLVSIFTAILALLFITFNNWEYFPWQKKAKIPQTESFFSWKRSYIRKILLYSTIVIFVVPFIINSLRVFHNNAMQGSPEGFASAYKTLIDTQPLIKSLMDLIIQGSFNLFHWFILSYFIRDIINNRQKKFTNFWIEVNSIEKRVDNFKHYYYYKESWAIANSTQVNLGDYNYLEKNPRFVIKDFLNNDLDIEDFARRNRKIIRYIEFCQAKVNGAVKKNFLNYCLFNEFNSWEDCLRTEKLIAKWTKPKVV